MSSINQSTNQSQENSDKKSEILHKHPGLVDPLLLEVIDLRKRVEVLEKMHQKIYCGCITHTHCGSMGCR